MPHLNSLNAYIWLALGACLALGCSKKEAAEPAEPKSTPASAATALPSTLLGVYKIDRYQQSGATCEELTDAAQAPARLVLYSFKPSDGSSEARLGGAFCSEIGSCRDYAKKAPEPAIGYSFLEGDDASGWKGWAVMGTGPVEQMCSASVQSHVLSSPKDGTIQIETTTVDVVFGPGEEKDGVASCSNKAAIEVTKTDLPCKSRLVLSGTREAEL